MILKLKYLILIAYCYVHIFLIEFVAPVETIRTSMKLKIPTFRF